jgi:urate oxidase
VAIARAGVRPDAVPGLFVGTCAARWSYHSPGVSFASYREGIRAAILDAFAMHTARSIQYTLHATAGVVLETCPDILDVTLSVRERPYGPAELFRSDPADADDLFVPAEGPIRTVEVTVVREGTRP